MQEFLLLSIFANIDLKVLINVIIIQGNEIIIINIKTKRN